MRADIHHIVAPQAQLSGEQSQQCEPKAALVACIDARKDINNLGFGSNVACLRNIGATIYDMMDTTTDHSPEYAAGVEDQKNAIKDALDQGVREFFIMNHDHCGGIGCLCGAQHLNHLESVYEHLKQNNDIKDNPQVGEKAVRISVGNLEAYLHSLGVEDAKVHGLIVNTATGALRELKDGEFGLLSAASADGDSDVMKNIRANQEGKVWSDEAPPKHEPKMLLIGEMSAPITSEVLNLHGNALFYREGDPCSEQMTIGLKSAVDFAKHMRVKHVTLMIRLDHAQDSRSSDVPPEALQQLRQGVQKLQDYIDSSHIPDITLHTWLMDTTNRIFEVDIEKGTIASIAEQSDHRVSRAHKLP